MNGTLTAPPPGTAPPRKDPRGLVLEKLRQREPALAEVPDDELLRRLRRTQPDVARALDDLAGVPRSVVLDGLIERHPNLRQQSRSDLARKVVEQYPDLAQRDPNLLKEAEIDAPKPAWVQGISMPKSLEPSRGGVPVYKPVPSAPEFYRAWQEQVQREVQKYQPQSDPEAVVRESLKSPPARVAAGLAAGILGFVEAPLGLAGYLGGAVNRVVKRWAPGLAVDRPEDQWLLNRVSGALDRAQQFVLQLTDDPDAGWTRNFFERVLPQGAASMLGFAKGGQWLVQKLGMRPWAAVAGLGGVQGANEALEKALAAGASDEDTLKNVLLGTGLGLTEAVPIAQWLVRSGAAKPLIHHLAQGVEEGVQEVIQQAGMQAGAKLTYDPKASLTEGLTESALAGVTLGSVGSKLMELASARRWRNDPRFRALAFSEAFDRLFQQPIQAAPAAPAPRVESVTAIPSVEAAKPFTARALEAAQRPAETQTAQAPTTAPPTETQTAQAPTTAPPTETQVAPALQTALPPESGQGPLPTAHTAVAVIEALNQYTDNEAAVLDSYGVNRSETIEAAQKVGLPGWLELSNPEQVGAYTAGWKAARDGVPPEQWMHRVPRRMLPVAAVGYEQGRSALPPSSPTPSAAPAAAATAPALLKPEPAERLLADLGYRPEDLPSGTIVGGRYFVVGQKVKLPETIPHESDADGRARLPVGYAWARVEDVVPSHLPDGRPNPDYRLVNTRDYLRNREELQKLLGAINGWDASLHTVLTPQSALGPPVVMAEGGKLHVVGGNTRSIAIRALPPVSFAMHTNAESAFAPMYGLPPAPADGHRYMVVRLMPRVPDALTDPKLAALLSDLLNESPGRRQSTLEMALADAAKVPLEIAVEAAGDFRSGNIKTDLISQLIRSGVIDANTRSALLEHEEDGQMYLRALLYRMGYGEKGAAIFRAASTTPATLLRWLPDAALPLALELRLSGADGAVLADLVGEYLTRLMSYGKAERLAQAFNNAAQQIEPGDWRYTAFIQGLGQLLANELVFVRTNKGAKRVELNGSQEGIGAVMYGMVRLVREYREDARVGTNLFGVEANLMRTLLQAIKVKVPGVIEKLEQLQGRALGMDWGLHEEPEPYRPGSEHEVPPVMMQPDGWERLPPHPLRPILEQISAVEPHNQPLQKLLNRLREQEAAERQEVRAAVEGGTPVEDAIAAVLRKRAGNLETQRLGMHRRLRQLVRRRQQLTQAELDELRMLERWAGQKYLDFYETTAAPPPASAERLLQLAAAARGDEVFQGLLPLSDPKGLEAAKLYQAANALSQATTGTPLSERPRVQQQELLGITGDLFAQSYPVHEGTTRYEPGTLFPTEPGGTAGAGRQRVPRTASAPRHVEVASGGVQSAFDFSGLARKRTRERSGPTPAPEARELIVRHARRLPVITELTHPEIERWMQQHVPRPGALLAHQRDGVRRILANFHTGAKHFLLADGTGVGKTRIALAVAQVSARVWGKPVLLVAPDERVIGDTYARDAAALGIELYRYRGEPLGASHQVLVATYTDVSRGVVDLKRFATLIFDEAHYLKNDDQLSTRAELGIQAMNQAERVLLMTATPLDEPWQLWYLTRVLGKNPEAALADLGITVEYRDVNGQPRRIYRVEEEHFDPARIQRWLEHNFEEAAARGNYLQRELRLDNLEVGLQQVGLSPDDLRRVEDVYAKVLQKYLGRGMTLGHAKAVALLAARSHLETYKVQAALRLVKERVRQGRQVVVYLHRVERVDTADQDMRPAQTLASLIEDVLGPNSVGRLYGGLSGAAAQQYAVEVMHRFRNGELPVIIATPQSGGVGLSLDDIHGDAPRSVLVLTAPFGAQDAVQIAGRVSRVTTRSQAELLFLHTGSRIDTWNLSVVLQKLGYLGAVIGPTAKALAPVRALPAKAEPALPPPERNEPDQVRIEAMVQSLPDINFRQTLDLEWWRRLEPAGNLRTALWRWAWLDRGVPAMPLIGRIVKGPEDLVALGQMLRNPAFEVGRVVLVNGEGRVVAVVSDSLGMPGTVHVPLNARTAVELARLARATGAVAMYIMHNHPSGNPTPSSADLTVPWRLLHSKGRYLLPLADPVTQQAFDDAITHLRSLFRASVVIDHLKGSIITYTKDHNGFDQVQSELRNLRLEDLPPEYRQWYEDALARSDQEILSGPGFSAEARQRYQETRERAVRALQGEPVGLPPDPFLVPETVQQATPGLMAGTLPTYQAAFVAAALALARAYKPGEGRRVPIMALSSRNHLRAMFYLHPLEFTNREVLVKRLAEAARLFGATRFAAVIDSTMGPLVREAAQEYVQSGGGQPAVLMEVVDADRGTGLAGPVEEISYAHEAALGSTAPTAAFVFREPSPPAYSVALPPGGGKGGNQVPVHLGGMEHVQPFNLPLMLQLYQAIMGPEEVPLIRRALRGVGVQGRFRSKDGTILLAREIFEDPELARRVLAHELGHWIDWNPDQTLARGNLWGRLASLRNYLKQTYGTSVVTNREFRDELIALTKWWRPWDENLVPESYNRYRRSAVELYADWISVLFNAPQEARARAPKFWQEFWAHLNTKADIQQALLDIQTELFKHGLESSDDKLVRSILESYQTAEERMLAIAEERRAYSRSLKRLMDELAMQLVDPFIPGERMERRALGGKPPTPVTARQPRRPTTLHAATEALAMREVVNYRMLKRVHERVVLPLQEAGVSLSELGLYLQLRRIAVGDRATFGNPGGVQPEDAERLLHAQELRLGPARTDLLRRAAEYFHTVAWEVSRRAVDSGLINRRTFETRIRPNREHYATFWVVRYVSDRITPLVREQVGTFEHVANPFIATLLKLMVTNSTIAYNNAARAQVDLLNRYFPHEIQTVKTDRTDVPGKGILRYFVDGRVQFAEVDKYLAEAFRRQDAHQTWRAIRLLGTAFRKLIYPFIITYNFGYLYLIAPWKDLRRTARNLAGARVPAPEGKGPARLLTWPSLRLLRRYPQALVDAWRHYYGDDRPIIREMLDHLALGTPWDVFARTGLTGAAGGAEGEFYVRMLQKAGVVSDEEMRGVFARLRNHVLVRPVAAVLDAIEAGGLAINDAPKIAAYRLLVERGLPRHEAARFTRRYAGLPHIHRRGLAVSTFHALWPFWNVAVQGYRADAELALDPKSAGAWWFRWANTDGLAAALAAAAGAGLLGWLLKLLYDGIPEYDKRLYTCIPIGVYRDDQGFTSFLKLAREGKQSLGSGSQTLPFGWKVVYIRIPRDEPSRMISGVLYNFLSYLRPEHDRPGHPFVQALAFGADQLPGVNPFLTIGRAWSEYVMGRVPTDPRTGQPLLSYYEQQAGFPESLTPMIQFTLRQMGIENFVKYDPEARTTTELAISAIPGVNRLIKVSDYGYREQQQRAQAAAAERELKSEHMLRYPSEVRRALAEYHELTRLSPQVRTWQQQVRIAEINYWRTNVFQPLDRLVLDLEREGKREEARKHREWAAERYRELQQFLARPPATAAPER